MFVEKLNQLNEEDIKKISTAPEPIRLFFEEPPLIEKLKIFNEIVLKNRNDVTLVLKSRNNNWIKINDFQSISNVRSIEFLTFNKNPKFDDLEGIELFKELKKISFSYNYSNNINLEKLISCPKLESLSLENMITKKHHKVLNELKELKKLSVKGLDMSLISEIPKLEKLFVLGLKNGEELDLKFPKLKTISIHRSNQINNLNLLENLKDIKSITLDSISNVESLPNLEKLYNLRGFSVMNMKRLKSIKKLPSSLENIRIGSNVPLLTIENLSTLTSKELPNLKEVTINLKTKEETKALLKQLGH